MLKPVLKVVLGTLIGFVLYTTSGNFGLLAILLNLFIPLPAVFLGMRYGTVFGVATAGLTTVAVLTATNVDPALFYLVQFGLPGALLPWLLKRFQRWDQAVAVTLGLIVSAGIVIMLLVSVSQQTSPTVFVAEQIEHELGQTSAFMEEVLVGADLSADEVAELQQVFKRTADWMQIVYPGLVVTMFGLLLLFLVAALNLMARGRYSMPGPAFALWKTPERLVWVLIATGFTVAFTAGPVHAVGLNLLVVLVPVYFLQGMAVLDCFLRRKSMSPLLRGFCYMLVTLFNPLPMVITGVGVFDLWIDFRKPREPKT
jgi:uncharacterized protein YybS (DUF2232 family)